jgi:APA family basic amino acid/polyamine antiporter
MARDRHLPGALADLRHAELAVGAVVVLLTATADLRGAIGFSSFGVLAYYAVANASAWTLRGNRAVPALGLAGCAVLAFALPPASVVAGAAVLAVGAGVYGARRGHLLPH